MSEEGEVTAAGIRLNERGERVAGGSVRSDGSVRKTLKVRPGFTPVEDVQRYSVRESIEKKKEENSDAPKRRTNRFAALNSVLSANNQENEKLAKKEISDSEEVVKATTKRVESSDIDDLQQSLSNLSVIPPTSSGSDTIVSGRTIPKSKVEPESKESTPKKKYKPPRTRKKYTLADLDNS